MTALLVIAVSIILYDYMTGRPFFQRCRVARCRLRRKRRPRRNRARYQDYANIDRILDGDDEAKRDLRAMFDERKEVALTRGRFTARLASAPRSDAAAERVKLRRA